MFPEIGNKRASYYFIVYSNVVLISVKIYLSKIYKIYIFYIS